LLCLKTKRLYLPCLKIGRQNSKKHIRKGNSPMAAGWD
jgi:hypothetical protein